MIHIVFLNLCYHIQKLMGIKTMGGFCEYKTIQGLTKILIKSALRFEKIKEEEKFNVYFYKRSQ